MGEPHRAVQRDIRVHHGATRCPGSFYSGAAGPREGGVCLVESLCIAQICKHRMLFLTHLAAVLGRLLIWHIVGVGAGLRGTKWLHQVRPGARARVCCSSGTLWWWVLG